MPGDDTRELKTSKRRLFYVPLALEIFILFIPFMILGAWYINSLTRELNDYQSGLSWITMVRLLEKESGRFGDRMNDDKLDILDLAADSREILLPDFYGTGHEPRATAGKTVADEIVIQYIFFGKDGSLMELNVRENTLSAIPEYSRYYDYAVSALKTKKPQESLMRTLYELDGKEYYGSFVPLIPVKPVCFGDIELSDGSKGDCILVSGRLPRELAREYIGAHESRMQLLTFMLFVLLGGVAIFAVYWSRRNLRILAGFISAFCNDDAELPEFDDRIVKEESLPEIKDLYENFQLMFLSLRKYQKSVSSIRALYEPLLPAALLALFNREDIREICPGDEAYVRGRVLSAQFSTFGIIGQEFAWDRNVLIKQILYIFDSMNMIVTELGYDRITAIRLRKDGEDRVILPQDKIDAIQVISGRGGWESVSVTDTEGLFCFTVTGAPQHMAIRMELIPEEIPEAAEYTEPEESLEYEEIPEAAEYTEPEESQEYEEIPETVEYTGSEESQEYEEIPETVEYTGSEESQEYEEIPEAEEYNGPAEYQKYEEPEKYGNTSSPGNYWGSLNFRKYTKVWRRKLRKLQLRMQNNRKQE